MSINKIQMPEELQYISDFFWEIIERSDKNKSELRKILLGLSAEEMQNFQEEFDNLSAEFQSEPFTDYTVESEDSIKDICDWVISQGKEYAKKIWENPSLIPDYIEPGDPEILSGVAKVLYWERFGKNIRE